MSKDIKQKIEGISIITLFFSYKFGYSFHNNMCTIIIHNRVGKKKSSNFTCFLVGCPKKLLDLVTHMNEIFWTIEKWFLEQAKKSWVIPMVHNETSYFPFSSGCLDKKIWCMQDFNQFVFCLIYYGISLIIYYGKNLKNRISFSNELWG